MPAATAKAIRRLAVYCLSDKVERSDHCGHIYNKSLLYLISHAFEDLARIPHFRKGVPLLGLEKCIEADPEVAQFFARREADLVLAPNHEERGSVRECGAEHHGDFDDDVGTVRSTLKRMLESVNGGTTRELPSPKFAPSASSLMQKRRDLDQQNRP
jgi:hypothetical protein